MGRVFILFAVLCCQFLQCLPQEQEPSLGEYFQEAVDYLNRNRWRYFLPEDTDVDQDGNLSDLEIQHKFNIYMEEVFKFLDHNKNNSITGEELRSLKLDIQHLTKVVDIALLNPYQNPKKEGIRYGSRYAALQQNTSLGEYFQEAVAYLNRNRWKYFLPEDTDIDDNGIISDLEIQHKFNTYMEELMLNLTTRITPSHDKDNSITEEELRSLKLDIQHLTKVVDFAPEQDASLGEYFQEAVDYLNRNHWRYFLPEDTDIDQDGNLSDLEIQHKFNTYMGEVFKLLDHDKDNSITEEELRSLKLDILHLTKVVDIALENYPLRPFFLAADANADGVFDENDFFIPEKKDPVSSSHRETKVEINKYNNYKVSTIYGVARIGQNEAAVICKSLGYDGVEKIVPAHKIGHHKTTLKTLVYSCNGTEEVLEDCKELEHATEEKNDSGMGVKCEGDPDKLGPLRLLGGKDSASGDVFFGKKGLVCNPGLNYAQNNFQVICRQLGYSGLLRVTKGSAFTGSRMNENLQNKKQQFNCTGNEQLLADCPVLEDGYCYNFHMYGVICATDGKTGMDLDLSDLVMWSDASKYWEESGRALFFADANGDGKLTLEELAAKGKEILTKALLFLDANQDGKISLEDVNLNLNIGPVQNLMLELFDDITLGNEELELFKINFFGQDPDLEEMGEMDKNSDKKITAADLFLDAREKADFLLPLLSQKLDKNQDGKIQREELTQFIEEMFNQLDMDRNGAITLEDVYSLLRDNGMDCLQVGVLRSYIKIFIETVESEIREFLSYIYYQFDLDGNGKISPIELEKINVPCDMSDRWMYQARGPNDKKSCGNGFFGAKISAVISSFPESIFSERHGRGGARNGPRRETFEEKMINKMINKACEMLTF